MQKIFEINTFGPGLYEFTKEVADFAAMSKTASGLLVLFVRHTSCSLLVTENADRDVKSDMKDFFARLVPENMDWIRHVCEGADDMPAHIKSALTPVSISIPLINGRLSLGTWQGIYLFEHRKRARSRQVIAHISA